MLSRFAVLLFWVPVAAQKLTAFDAASASSVYSTKSFGADLATLESSGCSCCSAQWGAKAFCSALCLVLGIGAALGLETWERQLAQLLCSADECVAGSMAGAKLFLGQDHSRPEGSCSG